MFKKTIICAAIIMFLGGIAFADYYNILVDDMTLKSTRQGKQSENNKEFVGEITELYAIPSGSEVILYLTLKQHPGKAFLLKGLDTAAEWGLLVAEKEAQPGEGSVRCKGWKVAVTVGDKLSTGNSKKKGEMTCYEVVSLRKL